MKTDVDPGFEEEEQRLIRQICGKCPHDKPRDYYIEKLLHYIEMENGNCPLDRDELTDFEWIDKGHLQAELQRLRFEWEKEQRKPRAKAQETDG